MNNLFPKPTMHVSKIFFFLLLLITLLTYPTLPPYNLLHPTYPNLSEPSPIHQNTLLSTSATSIQTSPSPFHPETVFPDPSTCSIYTTDARGFIWTLSPNHTIYTLHSTPGGTLLGGAIHPSTGTIYVCDSTRGLLHIPSINAPAEIVSAFVTTNPHDRVSYCNDVSISPTTGLVYFTSATVLHPSQREHDNYASTFSTYIIDTILGTRSGRVLEYDPTTRMTKVITKGLAFANGLAVHENGKYLLVAETGTQRLWKVGLEKEEDGKCGEKTVLAIMPGLPDGVSYDKKEKMFWVACFYPVPRLLRVMGKLPRWIRLGLSLVPTRLFGRGTTAMVVGVQEDGQVKVVVGDGLGKLGPVSAVWRCGEVLWLGNVAWVRVRDVMNRL